MIHRHITSRIEPERINAATRQRACSGGNLAAIHVTNTTCMVERNHISTCHSDWPRKRKHHGKLLCPHHRGEQGQGFRVYRWRSSPKKSTKNSAQGTGRSDPQKQVFDPSDPKLTQNVKQSHFKIGKKVRKSPVFISNTGLFFGSPCWTRTNDTRINSPSLYRLS